MTNEHVPMLSMIPQKETTKKLDHSEWRQRCYYCDCTNVFNVRFASPPDKCSHVPLDKTLETTEKRKSSPALVKVRCMDRMLIPKDLAMGGLRDLVFLSPLRKTGL